MKLYIKLSSLLSFQKLYDNNEYLQKILELTSSNIFYIKTNDLSEINRLLIGNNIKYKIVNDNDEIIINKKED